jgi:hypothetical protein
MGVRYAHIGALADTNGHNSGGLHNRFAGTLTSEVGQMTAARFTVGWPSAPCVSIVHSKQTLGKVLPKPATLSTYHEP